MKKILLLAAALALTAGPAIAQSAYGRSGQSAGGPQGGGGRITDPGLRDSPRLSVPGTTSRRMTTRSSRTSSKPMMRSRSSASR